MSDEERSERRRPRNAARLVDLTLIVRVPGRPADVRTFTDAEARGSATLRRPIRRDGRASRRAELSPAAADMKG